MKIPSYWAHATAEEQTPQGGSARLGCWRWSEVSREDAQRAAAEAARRIVRKFVAGEPLGRYPYGTVALREELKQEFTDARGNRIAAITQNAYGSLVLNTVRAMFVDVDFSATTAGEQLRYWFRRLFDRTAKSPADQVQDTARSRIDAFFAARPEWAARIYRTHSGLRVLIVHDLFETDGAATAETFEQLGADPLYRRLCRDQQCFRARLTPKPWRCGHWANPIDWPWKSDAERRKHETWQAAYLERQAGYATCRLVGCVGDRAVHPDIAPLVEIHDRLSRADEDLPLA